MSIATMTAHIPGAPPIVRERPDMISLAEASRILDLHPTTVQKMALAGRIRYGTRGLRTVYNREDVQALAS